MIRDVLTGIVLAVFIALGMSLWQKQSAPGCVGTILVGCK